MSQIKKIIIPAMILAVVALAVVFEASNATPSKGGGFFSFLLGDVISVEPGNNAIRSGALASSSAASVMPETDCGFQTSLHPKRNSLIFKEIAWMGDGKSPNDEWFSVQKISSGTLDVSGYEITNESGRIKIILPRGTVLTDEKPTFTLARQYGIEGIAADLVFSGAIKNSNEGLRLFDADCRLLDEVFAHPDWPSGNNSAKNLMMRNMVTLAWLGAVEAQPLAPKPASATVTGSVSPPGSEPTPIVTVLRNNSGTLSTASAEILIAGIVAGSKADPNDEFIELYNPGANTVDLTGWYIKKKSSGGLESNLVFVQRLEGKIILPKRYFLLARDGGYSGDVSPDIVWPFSYSLAYTSNSIALYAANGVLVDSISWSEIPEGKELERDLPNGSRFVIADPQPKNSSFSSQ